MNRLLSLIAPEVRENDPSHAQKDPTVVHYDGKWHDFMTAKLEEGYGKFLWRIGMLTPVQPEAVQP